VVDLSPFNNNITVIIGLALLFISMEILYWFVDLDNIFAMNLHLCKHDIAKTISLKFVAIIFSAIGFILLFSTVIVLIGFVKLIILLINGLLKMNFQQVMILLKVLGIIAAVVIFFLLNNLKHKVRFDTTYTKYKGKVRWRK